jgi:hypothetical protein
LDAADSLEWGRGVEYGRVPYRYLGGTELFAHVEIADDEVVRFLRADAEWHLPPSTRYEIRKALPITTPSYQYGRLSDEQAHRDIGLCKMAWYRNDRDDGSGRTDDITNWGAAPVAPDENVGYIQMGQFVTPARKDV